ncbi:MAG: hypothetical protein QGH33_13135 [Pirellulaceae bacterium]|nr:hypothetical protein [Pirellulaceae bacterium]HJN08047.1 hypothetical protein [Pirellulaceae bacterium]
MTRTRKGNQAEAPGQDSFLDIVANLVGILIILVIVIGVRARDALLEAAPVADTEVVHPNLAELTKDAETARRAANAVESDILDLEDKIKRQDLEIAIRRREREKVQMLVAQADQAIADRRDELSIAEQQRFDARRSVLAARQELETVQVNLQTVQNSAAPVTVIEHLPTPMAKTVFGKELHFRLHNGRLAFVPWDELVDRLQVEARQKVWRLKEQPELTETFGPIGGFWMKYTLKRVEYRRSTQMGVAVQRGVELDRFILIPEDDDMGEPLAEALQKDSQFHTLLAANQPEATTITVWTYPDSFDEFRELKRVLFNRSYLTASRPLSFDTPIGGSPHGTRSSAQ